MPDHKDLQCEKSKQESAGQTVSLGISFSLFVAMLMFNSLLLRTMTLEERLTR